MSDVKNLIDSWKQDGLTNPDSLEQAYQAITLLEARVAALEAKVQAPSKKD